MANVLTEEKKQQVLALGRLGWSLRQIQRATRIRRETASQYLKAAGIAVRSPGGWGRRAAKPANEVITDFGAEKAATAVKELAEASRGRDGDEAALENASALASGVSHFSTAPATAKTTAKPVNEVITDSEVITDLKPLPPRRSGRCFVGASCLSAA